MPKKKFYITTSIAYTNAFPHIGFALELIQADVIARYHRLLDDDVFFLTGTDEHGTKIARAAKEEGKDPKEFVDEISNRFRELTKTLNISNSDFIRTTDRKKHWPVVEKVWKELEANGDIYKKKYKGFYCAGCEAFITEKDLVDGRCPNHQKKPELVEEENYFFRLSKYSDKIKEKIEKDELRIIPETRKNEVLSLIKQGLEDVSFSRSREKLKWGIEVPGDPSQTIYVWADALVNYISVLGYKSNEKFKKYWPADVHCLGKDILKFHALIWPAILLSLGLKLPKVIFVHGYLTSGGQKMSKSLGNVVDPFNLVEKYGTDAVRYFLLREIPSTEDGDFTYEKFEARYNSDLASGLGNLVARLTTMAEKIEKTEFEKDKKDIEKYPHIKKANKEWERALEEFKFNEALKSTWDLVSFCDKQIDKEKPWEKKENSAEVLRLLLGTLLRVAYNLKPFLPETSKEILSRVKISGSSDKKSWEFKIKKGKPLFPRI